MIIGSIDSILADMASMLRRERLHRNMSQLTLAERSGLSVSAVKNFEKGKDAALSTFVQICRTLDRADWIMQLGPADAVSVRDFAKRGGRPRLRAAKRRSAS